MEKGRLIHKIPLSIIFYENGIQLGRIAYLKNDFISYDRIIGIYKIVNSGDSYMTSRGYLFHYKPKSGKKGATEVKIGGISGMRFSVVVSSSEFDSIVKLLRKAIGNRIDQLYIPNRKLDLTNGATIFKVVYE